MNSQWQIDLYDGLNNAVDMQDTLDITLKIIKPFGFDFCGWRSKLPLPMSHGRYSIMHTGEDEYSQLEISGRYDNAPIPKHCSQSIEPISWRGTTEDPTFLKAPELWEEYYADGHYGGWAQSIIESKNLFSMIYVDSNAPLLQKDLDNIDLKMQWVAVSVLTKINQIRLRQNIKLSEREKEVLRWTGDGKTSSEIGQILNLSHSTINFHIRNAMFKLDAPNKTSAVVKAIYLHLLH